MKKEIQVRESLEISLRKYTDKGGALILSKEIKGKSLDMIRESGAVTIATIRKERGVDQAERLILQFLLKLSFELNLQNKVSEESLSSTAEDLYEISYYLNVEELAYFFSLLRKGRFGSMYENLNSEKVCQAMDQFLSDRAIYHQKKEQNRTKELNRDLAPRHDKSMKFREMSRDAIKRWKSGDL